MNSEQPNNRRIQLIVLAVVAVLAAAGLAFGLVKMTGSDGGSDQPEAKVTTTAPATQPRRVIAMVEHGEQHALLDFKVYPEGGQVTGTYTLVHFDGNGRKVEYPKAKPFNGMGTGSRFQLNDLGDRGPVTAELIEGETRLQFDQTFGVEELVWEKIDSTQVFDDKVTEYAKRFESCSKKHDYNPCEGVS
ncbi:hypothetical protein [Actinomadura mexicana]|uniref:Uncharacterized protein n=1 Tax=Actinomadura mexicana TaxID=134959 RepID=A0A238WWW5_9ACTN|nr:hypothetical protein [Actinomadura mexicana]SNR50986.1 hypothetical protein SAMN06265355_103409 [Actinomadura mexicana]